MTNLFKTAFKIGGPGSGNFGHAGRPGLVGGSAPSKGRVGFSFETIRENAGIRIDSRYMNLDNEARNKIDSAAADFCTEYPEVKGTVKIFRVREDRAGVMAYYNTEDKAVILNSEFFEGESLADIEKRYQHNIQRNLTPKGTDFTAAIHHEMSHGLLRRLEAKKGEKVFKEIRNKSLKNLGLKVKDIGNNLSAYAASDSEEFIAEAFAEVGTSKNPRDLSKMAVGITLQYLRGD